MRTFKKTNGFKDKREHQRKKCSTSIGYASLDKNHTAIIKNISEGGVCLDTPEALDVGRDIAMKIQLSREQEPIVIIGEVVWNSPSDMGVKFKMGFDASLMKSLMDTP